MPERAFLVRHGQTVWNAEHRLHGRQDSPLTADGIRQACEMAKRLRGRGISTVCSSPLGRALRTAVIIADEIGAQLVQVPELTEIDHGAMTGMTWTEIDEVFPGARAARAENRYGWAFPGGESYAQARARAREALTACGWAADGVPVLVSHEQIGRMLRAELRALRHPDALALRHPHGVVFEIDRSGERIL